MILLSGGETGENVLMKNEWPVEKMQSSCEQESTFHCDVDTRCKKQSPEAIVEDLIALKGRCGMIGDLNTL